MDHQFVNFSGISCQLTHFLVCEITSFPDFTLLYLKTCKFERQDVTSIVHLPRIETIFRHVTNVDIHHAKTISMNKEVFQLTFRRSELPVKLLFRNKKAFQRFLGLIAHFLFFVFICKCEVKMDLVMKELSLATANIRVLLQLH